MKRSILWAAAAFVALASPAAADPVAVRGAIEAQLAALADGDAEAAYALAAPSIQKMFPTPERFIGMVKRGYAPVTTARATVFLRAREIEAGRFAQEVGFVDGGGQPWTALYTLSRQGDGAWRIDGCYLKKAVGTDA